jgi:hypothetical protein
MGEAKRKREREHEHPYRRDRANRVTGRAHRQQRRDAIRSSFADPNHPASRAR